MLCSDLTDRVYESLKTLACLANSRDALKAHEIALRTKLPPAQTAKVLQSLRWGGFVSSQRGSHGGFWLVRPAGRIRVAEVIDFFTGRNPQHSQREQDPLLSVLRHTVAGCQKKFDKITVADLAKALGPKSRYGSGRVQQRITSVPGFKDKLARGGAS